MAKLIITGDAMVITSEMALEDIKKLEKYCPKALVLTNEKDEEVFKVGTGSANINQYGVSFEGVSRTGDGKACLTLTIPSGTIDVVKYASDKYGMAIVNLNKVESVYAEALAVVEEQQAEILSNITVA